MKYFIIGLLVLGSTIASAEVRRKVVPGKQAEVNGQMVTTEKLKLDRLSLTTRDEQLAPLTRSRSSRPPVQTLKHETLRHGTLDLSTRSSPMVPTTNFEPRHKRRPPPETPTLTHEVRAQKKPPVTDRTIRANTEKGEAELKEELRTLPQ